MLPHIEGLCDSPALSCRVSLSLSLAGPLLRLAVVISSLGLQVELLSSSQVLMESLIGGWIKCTLFSLLALAVMLALL